MSVRITSPKIRALEETARNASPEDYPEAERALLKAIEELEDQEIRRLGAR